MTIATSIVEIGCHPTVINDWQTALWATNNNPLGLLGIAAFTF